MKVRDAPDASARRALKRTFLMHDPTDWRAAPSSSARRADDRDFQIPQHLLARRAILPARRAID
ncbi:hypothetical protein A2U01_0066817 [Trifolium medium]|uniref:Uncharacterized protein n=1 Tax=Trifolium medium TaxID=97028 RepID=A0A392S9R0_9FABA|nr:hypothetical protein [Trifolium medium]